MQITKNIKLQPDIIERSLVRPYLLLNRLYQINVNHSQMVNSEKKYPFSDVKIDVIITATKKDLDTLPYCINGVIENVKHPIGKIKIIAPISIELTKFCESNNYILINEDTVLPITKNDIHYFVNGVDRRGWIYQQFLKYSEHISDEEHYLTIDADTVYIRPQTYIRDGKTLVLTGDDYFPPYNRMLKKLFGYSPYFPKSYVCHQNFFNKRELINLKKAIEQHTGKIWYQAILDNLDDKNTITFAENLTYGWWMWHNYPDKVVSEYYFNKCVSKDLLTNFDEIKTKYKSIYKSLSFQVYIKQGLLWN